MITKYNIGDVVTIPAKVERISVNNKGCVYYDFCNVVNNTYTGLADVPEKEVIGILNDRKIPKELLDKKVLLIKQLRECNGFSHEEISMIMNMDDHAVCEILYES